MSGIVSQHASEQPMYRIKRGDAAHREAVEDWLVGLNQVSERTRDMIVTAWVSIWLASPYDTIDAFPYSVDAPDYGLAKHVNDVTRHGLRLAAGAMADWGLNLDPELLVPILTLHDVDKPLMFVRDGSALARSALSQEVPHGVVGAMLLKELGFPHVVVSTVAVHAGNAPFHGNNFEAMVLHYADYFSTDYVYRQTGAKPFYQRPWR